MVDIIHANVIIAKTICPSLVIIMQSCASGLSNDHASDSADQGPIPSESKTLSPVPSGLDQHLQYVAFSVPAQLAGPHAPASVRIEGSDRLIPLQARPLGNTPSPRWWFCETMAPRGSKLVLHDTQANAPTQQAVASWKNDQSILLKNDHLQLQISSTAASPITAITYQGKAVHADESLELSYKIQGRAYSVAQDPTRKIEILCAGPIRAAVQISGQHFGPDKQPGLNYRLRIELLADLPVVVMHYWFFHCLPGVEEIPVDAMQLSLSLKDQSSAPSQSHGQGQASANHFKQLGYGITGVPRDVTTAHKLDARVGHEGGVRWRLSNAEALEDDVAYPPYMRAPTDAISTWIATSLSSSWCAAAMDDVSDMQPKGLRLDRCRFDLDIWPAWSPSPMELLQGRSRQITFRMAFGDLQKGTSPDTAVIESTLAASKCTEPLLFPPEAYAAAGVFEQHHLLKNDGAHERFNTYLGKVACPPTVADMFDLGDTPDPGYKTTYLRVGRLVDHLAPESSQRGVQYLTGGRNIRIAPWSDITQFEQVWANNEYDVIWTLGGEIMRSGNRDLLVSLRWFARHAIEVDFVHYSDHFVKHRTTPPHCARHTTAGAYPSHFWTQGVLQYYALTGDEDALVFARAICDKIIEMFDDPAMRARLWHPTRELGWALLSLASLIEFDPDPRYIKLGQEIANDLVSTPMTDEFIDSAVLYAFGFASIVLGVDRWHDVQPQQRHRDWLVLFAQKCASRMACTPGIELAMGLCILHAGYKHSGDQALVRHGMRVLERIIDSKEWFDPSPYTKPFALLHRPLARFFADAAHAGFLSKLNYRF